MPAELPARKRWLFRLGAIAAMVLGVEASSYVLFRVLFGTRFSIARASAEREYILGLVDPRMGVVPLPFTSRREVNHPYLGYVWDAEGRRPVEDPDDLRNHGMSPLAGHLARTPMAGHVRMAILGGSVAEGFGTEDGAVTLVADLRRAPELSGCTIDVVTLGLAGYKQPQQVMALAYFLSLGARFDVVIELDGFNEIALPAAENVAKRVYPYFPRSWYFRVSGVDHDARVRMGRLTYVIERRQTWARLFSRAPLRFSATAGLVWKRYDVYLLGEELVLQSQLAKAPAQPTFEAGGPFRPQGDAELAADLARHWARCSREMNALCAGLGIRYYHFLQPNQWVPGSKTMGPREGPVARPPGSPWQSLVEGGYPALRTEGARLAAEGVAFHDMTGVFADHPEGIYIDECCHYNKHGNNVLAHAMAAAIIADMRAQGGFPRCDAHSPGSGVAR